MAFVRPAAAVSSAALSLAGCGFLAYWTAQKSKIIPEGQRGDLATRMVNVLKAVPIGWKMQDPVAAKQHFSLVASLSTEEGVNHYKPLLEREWARVKKSGYLAEAHQESVKACSVFRYIQDNSQTKFFYSGPSQFMHDEQARADILQGNYLRLHDTNIVITGTTNPAIRFQFLYFFLRDSALLAAEKGEGRIHPQTFYSDTPVFLCGEKCQQVGDLMKITSAEARQEILARNFTICPSNCMRKTRLSGEQQKMVGIVLAGIQDDEVCDQPSIEHWRNSPEPSDK